MSNYENLKSEIKRAIKENGNQEITGDLLQAKLLEMIDTLGEGYTFMGVATPSGEPISTDARVYYIANEVGVYPYYGGINVADGEIALLVHNKSWQKMAIGGIVTDNKLSETVRTIDTTIGNTKEELNKNIKKLTTDLNDNYRTKEELENVLGFETLERVAGYSYVGIVNEATESVIDIDATSKVYYIVVAPIDYETLFNGLNSEAKGYTYVKSVEGQWVVEDLGIPFDLQGSLDGLNTKISQVENTAKSKVEKQQSAEQGNVVMFGEGGEVADSGIEASNVAKQNGYYESMIVGASKNLAGNNIVTAKYTYRPTADTTDVADGVAKISSVKGNTIVWNQRFKDAAITNTNNGVSIERLNGVISLNGTVATSSVYIIYPPTTEISINLHHIGYYRCTIVKDLNNVLQNKEFGLFHRATKKRIEGTTVSFIYKNTNDSSIWTFGFTGFTVGDILEDVQIKVNVFDLTQMFGEGNEPTLEEFEAMFPNSYYEYNEGELKSIEDFQIKSVGFNQWDEDVISGYYRGTDGVYVYDKSRLCSKNPIKAIPNGIYYLTAPTTTYIQGYDENMNYIGILSFSLNTTITIPDNIHWIYFGIIPDYGTTYNNDICINLSHSGIRNGEYESYREDILPINISAIKDNNGEVLFPNGLCSAGEAHDELVYDKSISKWKAIKRIGSVDMGSLNWIYISITDNYPYGVFDTDNKNIINRLSRGSLICSKYPKSKGETFKTDKTIVSGGSLYIVDSSYTDSETFKASLQGQILYYELAEPIEVVLDDFTSNYKVSDWGTEEILMNSTPIVPVIYDVEYALNAVDTLRNMPTNYISKESLDAFLSTLGSAMGGTWSVIYNETNGRYDFSFSANAVTTELIEE